jgi:hypothetical protein
MIIANKTGADLASLVVSIRFIQNIIMEGLKMQLKVEIEGNTKVLEALKKNAAEGWISCATARGLAEELGVEPIVIGQACNLLKIKIKSCVLGCFN